MIHSSKSIKNCLYHHQCFIFCCYSIPIKHCVAGREAGASERVKPMKRHIEEFDTRKKLWYELIDSEILTLFHKKKIDEAYKRAKEILGEELVDEALAELSH